MQPTQPSSKNLVLPWAQKVVHFNGKMTHSGTFSVLSAPEGFWKALGGARDGPILNVGAASSGPGGGVSSSGLAFWTLWASIQRSWDPSRAPPGGGVSSSGLVFSSPGNNWGRIFTPWNGASQPSQCSQPSPARKTWFCHGLNKWSISKGKWTILALFPS